MLFVSYSSFEPSLESPSVSSSSSEESRLSWNDFQTPVPFTSSVCPAAYINVSNAVFMDQ